MVRFIKLFYRLSNTALAIITVLAVTAQFIYSAVNAGRIEVANQRIEKLTMLSLAQLGEIKVNG